MRAALIVIAAAFLLVGGIFLFIAGGTLFRGARYSRDGMRAEAVTTGKALHRATSTTNTAYEVTYRITLPGEAASERTESVPVHVWERVEQGSALSIEYIPGQADSSRVMADRAGRPQMLIFVVLGAGLVLGGLVALKSAFARSSPADVMPPEAPATVPAAHEPSFWPLARQSSGFWLGGIFLLVGLLACLGGAVQLYGDWSFPRQARTTRGMVLTKEIERSGKRNETKRYKVTYRFTVDGRTFEGHDELSFERWHGLREREPMEVLYLPQKPSSSRLPGPRPWLGKTTLTVVGALFSVVGWTFFFGAVRQARLEWRLRQSGVHAPGTVTELRDRHLKINGVRQWRLHYEFSDYQGRRHQNTTDLSEDEAQAWKIGEIGKVLYDSAQPSEAMWLGRA